jgi:hypothetical protein
MNYAVVKVSQDGSRNLLHSFEREIDATRYIANATKGSTLKIVKTSWRG